MVNLFTQNTTYRHPTSIGPLAIAGLPQLLGPTEKQTMLYVQQLTVLAKTEETLKKITSFSETLTRLEDLSRKTWEPSDAQQVLENV
ncbi:hypothetical protein H0H81_004838 [Sphagnurus paluster]|uniref:Uncharacterized protein n=1 Tax=Sphagnurus paluster TaxID=117069 RepID=A0A9P7FLH8_9AGAR|nr:hypothetical protein H0H81_004838 [Sphagnurus paluster]